MRIRPRGTAVWWIEHLPRAGRVRVSFDVEGRVRVRPLGPRLAKGAARFASPGWALGALNLGSVIWYPEVAEHVTLTPAEREQVGARVESVLRYVVDSRWFRSCSAGW